MWNGTKTATDEELEAALPIFDRSNAAQVVHRNQSARFMFAAAEGDLEFSAEILCIGMAQQVKRRRLRVRRHIEGLSSADARQRAGRHVANRISARLACGDSHRCQAIEDIRRIFDVNVMELNVLPRRNMADTVG